MNFINIDIFINRIEFEIYTIESQQRKDLSKDKIIIPKSFNIGNKLSYVRRIINTFIDQYNVKMAFIEINDDLGIEIIDTVKMEGIIEELFSNCGVEICK